MKDPNSNWLGPSPGITLFSAAPRIITQRKLKRNLQICMRERQNARQNIIQIHLVNSYLDGLSQPRLIPITSQTSLHQFDWGRGTFLLIEFCNAQLNYGYPFSSWLHVYSMLNSRFLNKCTISEYLVIQIVSSWHDRVWVNPTIFDMELSLVSDFRFLKYDLTRPNGQDGSLGRIDDGTELLDSKRTSQIWHCKCSSL